jgi:hypothetical protein
VNFDRLTEPRPRKRAEAGRIDRDIAEGKLGKSALNPQKFGFRRAPRKQQGAVSYR